MGKGKPTYMNAPLDLYGHMDEDMAVVSFMSRSLPELDDFLPDACELAVAML